MREAIARYVHPIFHLGLELARRTAEGSSIEVDVEQAELEAMLFQEPIDELARELVAIDRSVGTAKFGSRAKLKPAIDEIRYLLICWLDDIFILSSPLGAEWSESKLEVRLTGRNDRSSMFWVHAREAERQHRTDVLEVAHLCVALGFRGEMADDPDHLVEWRDRTKRKITADEPWPSPPALSWTSVAHPLYGLERFRRMAFVAAVVALASIPVFGLLLTVAFGR
jgi:type IV/VI secretion system ImpK/VasF family protein